MEIIKLSADFYVYPTDMKNISFKRLETAKFIYDPIHDYCYDDSLWMLRERRLMLPFEVDVPDVEMYVHSDGEKVIIIYPDGEIIQIIPHQIETMIKRVSMQSYKRVQGYYLSNHNTSTELEYIDPYYLDDSQMDSGLGCEGDRFLTKEEISQSIWPGIYFDLDFLSVNPNMFSYIPIEGRCFRIIPKEYEPQEGRKTFYFIKNAISILLYNIKREHFLEYYKMMKESLSIIPVDSTLFTKPIKEVICNWRSVQIDEEPNLNRGINRNNNNVEDK